MAPDPNADTTIERLRGLNGLLDLALLNAAEKLHKHDGRLSVAEWCRELRWEATVELDKVALSRERLALA